MLVGLQTLVMGMVCSTHYIVVKENVSRMWYNVLKSNKEDTVKRITALLLILSLVLCLSACGACGRADTSSKVQGEPASESVDDSESGDIVAEETVESLTLLEGYPEDVLPLYESTAIQSCGFTYREDSNYVLGKDFYDVIYTSDATLKDISAYYQSLLTYMDEYSEEDFLEGDIGDHHVLISIYDKDGVREVTLTLGLAEDEYKDENPYFSDLPEDLVEVYGLTRLQEISYVHNLYSADEIRYMTIYETDTSEEDFVDFYMTKYGQMKNFNKEQTDYALFYRWVDGEYDCSVNFSPGDYAFITIEINPIME